MILGIGMRGIFPYLPSADQASSIMASTVMSPLLGSLFLVAMLSAIMSTVNSILLVTGGAFAHDLYKRLVNPQAIAGAADLGESRLDRRARRWCRSGSRTQKLGDVQAIVVEQAKFIASFFFVPVVLGLNWRRGTKEGAIWSMVAGFLGCLVWTFTLAAQLRLARHRLGRSRRRAERADASSSSAALTPPTPAENLRIFFDEDARHAGPGRRTRERAGQVHVERRFRRT